MILKVVPDPAITNRFYVASEIGLFRSLDGGVSFERVLTSSFVYDVVVNPANPSILYAAVGHNPNNPGDPEVGIYKSIDGGASWAQLSVGFPANTSTATFRVTLAPSAPDILIVTAFVNDGSGLNFYKSMNGGSTWNRLTTVGARPTCQCPFDEITNFDPTNPNIVYFGGISLLKSVDGGTTWSDISTGVDGKGIHPDQQALTFDSNRRLYVGNDGGIWRSADGGLHWDNLNTNLSITQFYRIALHPTDANGMIGGTQDNGTLKYAGIPDWQQVLGGDGGAVAIDFTNPDILYAETTPLVECPYIYRSDNGGSSFTKKGSGINCLENKVALSPPFVMDPSNATRLLAGLSKVYQTVDRGENWSPISPQFSTDPISTIAIAPSSSSTAYIGFLLGFPFPASITHDGGATWKNAPDLPFGVSQFAIDPENPGVAYAAINGYGRVGNVFRTIDGGTTWQNISGNLPKIPVHAIVIDAGAPQRILYIGTDLGVFRSLNDGSTWELFNHGLPNALVMDLALNPQTRVLAAATFGRGVFTLANPVSGPDTVTILNALFVNPLSLLFVSATSSAAPEAELFVTVPEDGSCVESAPMKSLKSLGTYFFLKRVPGCGSLDGQTATVNSSLGGSNSAPTK